MVVCGFKNGCQKDTCLQEIGLYVQILLNILTSKANLIEGINENENFHFDDE